MQRLTKRIRHTETVVYVGEHKVYDTGDIPVEMNFAGVRDVLQRLAAYEDTRLIPEEINKLDSQRKAMAALADSYKAEILCWIPAEVELPGQEEVGKYYAQYGEHPQYIVMIAHAVKPTILAFDGEGFYDPADNEIYKVTHWMPLPAAPTEGT